MSTVYENGNYEINFELESFYRVWDKHGTPLSPPCLTRDEAKTWLYEQICSGKLT